MRRLWSRGDATVGAIHEDLASARPRPIAYTTVMKVVDRLHDKELVSRRREGRRHVYRSALDEEGLVAHLGGRAADVAIARFGAAACVSSRSASTNSIPYCAINFSMSPAGSRGRFRDGGPRHHLPRRRGCEPWVQVARDVGNFRLHAAGRACGGVAAPRMVRRRGSGPLARTSPWPGLVEPESASDRGRGALLHDTPLPWLGTCPSCVSRSRGATGVPGRSVCPRPGSAGVPSLAHC